MWEALTTCRWPSWEISFFKIEHDDRNETVYYFVINNMLTVLLAALADVQAFVFTHLDAPI